MCAPQLRPLGEWDYGNRELGLVLLACGFAAGVLTDLLVVYGGS